MKLLFLTTYYHPSRDANAPIITPLCEQLHARGHDVQVVTAVPHYRQKRLDSKYRGIFIHRSRENGVRVNRTWVSVGRFPSILERIATYATYHVGSVIASSLVEKPDLIVTLTPPVTNGAVALALSVSMNVPFVFVAQDLYPDIAIELGVLKNRLLISSARIGMRHVFTRADKVIAVSKAMRERMASFELPKRQIEVIENAVDTDAIYAREKNLSLLKEMGWEDKFVILYSGNIGLSQPLSPFLKAASELKREKKIHFTFIGRGEVKERLQQRARQMMLDNVSFQDLLPRELVPDLYQCADVCLVALRSGLDGLSFPSKILSIMAAGKPVLAFVEPTGEVAKYIQRTGCGKVVSLQRPEALSHEIFSMYKRSEENRQMGLAGRNYVVANNSISSMVESYERVFVKALHGDV